MKAEEIVTNPLPANPFADSDPQMAMLRCAQVCGFLADAVPSMEHSGIEIGENESHGISWILEGVAEALRHAQSTTAESHKGSAD